MADRTLILQPLSDEAPCGPDLVAADDAGFLTFRDRLEGLLPVRMAGGRLMREDGQPFEPRDIRPAEEAKTLARLLERSRDLRFLLIDARLRLLAGDLPGLAGAIGLSAELLATRWGSAHPRDVAQRRGEFESFEPPVSGSIPLQFVPLLRDRRAGAIRFRDFLVATGEAAGPEGERTPDEATIRSALADAANAAAVDAARGALAATRDAFGAVRAAFAENGEAGAAPQMKTFLATVARILALIDEARGSAPSAGAASDTDPAAPERIAAPDPALRPAAAIATVPIADHRQAAEALVAAEAYFAGVEPSSPALLLIHQARTLIGRPLVEALQVLAPNLAVSASLDVGGPAGFALDLGRLASLGEAALQPGACGASPASSQDPPSRPAETTFAASTREAATALVASVEAYFHKSEPSSPVPLLLARARSLVGRDFLALLPQLFPSLRQENR
ncbi:ImpA family type VI secretion system protein [Jiella sonneratiae]|uniref:Type VI secretion system ImpA family N-terminal domain-containing protein n=1 Tax=Jiella sonneratiae TaxID=2816856 RepID=A0ABS3J980_9HYPH|nr:type VI secretion system ImpA family N-terminal domain-containing protein [Jiella sonneratiae]MBO0905483.1 type VI secretion system ImpA family N-terminal domain-containing protein [Jiella sonneratiae]